MVMVSYSSTMATGRIEYTSKTRSKEFLGAILYNPSLSLLSLLKSFHLLASAKVRN
jgi:hypothetical protein